MALELTSPTEEFVAAHTVDVTLRDGGHVRIRPIVPSDKSRLAAGLARMSPESRYRRFFTAVDELTPSALAYLTEIDYTAHFAWGALDLDEPDEPGVGVARYVRLPDDPETAEVAVAVVDDHQSRGIGTLLLEVAALTAREHGIRRFVATVLPANAAVAQLVAGLGVPVTWDRAAGTAVVELPVAVAGAERGDRATFELLRAAARGDIEVRLTGRAERP